MALTSTAFAQEGPYGGLAVGDDSANGTSLGVFGGYEMVTDEVVYTAVEASYQAGNGKSPVTRDRVAVDVKGGVKLVDPLAVYMTVGYGGTPDTGGVRYGIGGKYFINDRYSVGTDYIHQEFSKGSTDTVLFKGALRF